MIYNRLREISLATMNPSSGSEKFGALLILLLTVWTTSTVKGQLEGDVRLVDGPDMFSGTLEYFTLGAWGRVCPAGWDAQSTAVACWQLGFTGAVSAFTNVDEILVDWTPTELPLFNAIQGTNCNGSESKLSECTLNNAGNSGACNQVGFLGIVCTNHSEGDVRLADSAGVVEVFTAGDWHPVCADDEWDAMAINRLCIDLGHTSGVVQSPQPLLSDTVIRTSVSCNASNEHLSECLPDSLDLRSGSQCPSNTVLTVDCEATRGDLRLLGGPQSNVGQLEMWFDGEWLSPCASEWNNQAAMIACSELGFAGVSSWFSTEQETFEISGPSGREGAITVMCLDSVTNVINCQTSPTAGGTCQPNGRVILVCEGTTLQPQISNIEASASEITVTYSLGNNVVSNAAAADHDRLRSLTLNYNLKSVLGTLSPVPVSAQTVTRVGSQIAAIFPVPANEELQPFLIYEMQMSLAVRGLGGPSSDTRTFIRGLQAEVTVELNTTTARFTWPLVTSPQVTVSGYTIDIEATDPEGLISIPSALIQSQQNTHLLSDLEEGVRYRFQLYAATTIQQDMLIPNRHEGQFTTDTAAPSGSPLNFMIESVTALAVMLSWQAPELIDQNGEITHYVITYKASGSSDQMEELVMSAPGNDLPADFTYNHMLQGLVQDTQYSVQVAAATTSGTGPSVSLSFNTSAPTDAAGGSGPIDPLPYILAAVGFLVLLVLVIVILLVVAICLWHRRHVGAYTLKNLRSNRWVNTPHADSPTHSDYHEVASPTTGMGVFSPPIHEDPTLGNSYDSLSPKDIEDIVAGSAMRDKAHSFPLSKTDNADSNHSSTPLAQESENYAPALVHALDDEASPQIHVYEDPVNINRKASTLPTQQRHLVDPSDYLLPSPTEKSMSANMHSFDFPRRQKEPYYEVPPGVNGPQYANNPDIAAPQYSNTLDMSELESMRDHGGYSPLWSHSGEKKDLSHDAKHSSLSNSVQYATPKKFPVPADGVAGYTSPRGFGYEVMPTSPEPTEPSDTHYGYTSSTPVPEHLQ